MLCTGTPRTGPLRTAIRRELVPPAATGLAGQQRQVLSRRQLHAVGVDHDRIRHQVEARRWQTIGPRVVVLGNADPTKGQWWWVAVLNAGPQAALAGATALEAHGLRGFEAADAIHVAVPAGNRVPALPGVKVHHSRRLTGAEIHPVRRPPVHVVERALVDAAAWQPRPRYAAAVLAAAIQQRLTTAERVRQTLLAQGRLRHLAVMLITLADVEGGAQALSEIDFVALCRRRGLPEPLRQTIRRDSAGRRRYLDVDFGTFVVEIDGMHHADLQQFSLDAIRRNDLLTAGGRPMLCFPAILVRCEPDTVVRQLMDAFRRFGH